MPCEETILRFAFGMSIAPAHLCVRKWKLLKKRFVALRSFFAFSVLFFAALKAASFNSLSLQRERTRLVCCRRPQRRPSRHGLGSESKPRVETVDVPTRRDLSSRDCVQLRRRNGVSGGNRASLRRGNSSPPCSSESKQQERSNDRR